MTGCSFPECPLDSIESHSDADHAVPRDMRLPVTWVTVRGSSSTCDVLMTCERCKVRLIVPQNIDAHRFDDLLTGFCCDHRSCAT